jgi:hypothetical protein
LVNIDPNPQSKTRILSDFVGAKVGCKIDFTAFASLSLKIKSPAPELTRDFFIVAKPKITQV